MDLNQQKTHSIWQDQIDFVTPTLNVDLETEVCIVGGGISGLTTAYLLLKEGRRVCLLDRENFAYDETGLSSAHISNALDDGYAKIERLHGRVGAKLAYQSHTKAINRIEKIVRDEEIECDFKRVDGFLFCGPKQNRQDLEKELVAAARAGMEDLELITHGPLKLGPCLHYKNQAQFNPVKYMKALAQKCQSMGAQIYSHAMVTDVESELKIQIRTLNGHRVQCEHVVMATNVPTNDRMAIHTKEAAYRTYVIGFHIPRGLMPDGLYWDTSEPYHYVRIYQDPNQKHDVLLVGGEDHKVGQERHPEERYARLEDWAIQKFNLKSCPVEYHWSGQIIEPVDGLAFIGRNPGDSGNIWIAAGDSGHGITHGTIAGLLLTDLILGRSNPWETLYHPSRISFSGMGKYLKENLNTALQYFDWASSGEVESVREIQNGDGAIVRDGFSKVAAYRDTSGNLYEFSATCPHLGGVVQWNSAEQTWDCPCHGSRFTKYGEVINGPACQNLSPHKDVVDPELTSVKEQGLNQLEQEVGGGVQVMPMPM